jgi:hypothetical protein
MVSFAHRIAERTWRYVVSLLLFVLEKAFLPNEILNVKTRVLRNSADSCGHVLQSV